MNNMKENLFSKIAEKMVCSLGETSIKISENALGCCCWGAVYETKIPIELLKEHIEK